MISVKKLVEDIWKLSKDTTTEWSTGGILALIEKQPKIDCSDCSRRKWYQKGYEDALKANKWIPISKGLPKVYANYNVSCKNSKGEEWTTTMEFDGIKFGGYDSFHKLVVAWQPLPEHYKEMEEVVDCEEPCASKEFLEECKEVARKYRVITKADTIRNMSDEELACWLFYEFGKGKQDYCYKTILECLKQKVV